MRTIGLSQLLQRFQDSLSVHFSITSRIHTKEKILNGIQFGFFKKSSTDAVLHLLEALLENYDNFKISVAVFIDLFSLN